MKKKELLKMQDLTATSEMIRIAKADQIKREVKTHKSSWGTEWKENIEKCRYCRYFMAAVEGEYLKVAIFDRVMLRRGSRMPIYEVFVSKTSNQYITREPKEDKWRTAKINMLQYENIWRMHTEQEWQTKQTRKLVNDYFETGKNLNVFQAVLDFQSEVRQEDRRRKYQSEIEQIDATMKEVPGIPKGFETWIQKNCFGETLFYTKERRYEWPKVFCTHCQSWSDAPGMPEHGKEVKCPKCGVKAKYRSWNKQKEVMEEANVAILQKLNNDSGYILRGFHARSKRRNEKGWENVEFSCYENTRARLGRDFREEELFEYGEYKNTGVTRWCHELRKSGYGMYYSREYFGRYQMYTPNLKRELKNTTFKNMDLKKLFKGGQKTNVDPEYLLQRINQYPFIEYLQKSGLETITQEIMNCTEIKNLFDNTKIKINEVLKLDKQRFQRLRKCDGNCNVLYALQMEQRQGEKLTDKNIEYIMEENVKMSEIECLMNRTGMNMQRMLNYIQRQQKTNEKSFRDIRRLYEDYLDMAEGNGMDLKDEIVCKQSRMMEFHDRYVEEKNKRENRTRDEQVNKKFKGIKTNYKKYVERFSFETDEFTIRVPKMASDITKEGRKQHHCVGASDTYIKRMENEQSFIIFLRHKKNPSIPYYTLEVKWDGEIVQWYAAYDRKPNEKEIKKVLEKWTTAVQKREQKLMEKQRKAIKEIDLVVIGHTEQHLVAAVG